MGSKEQCRFMTRVKICGITSLEDALAAAEAGADALGFIAVRESPRFVTPEAFDTIRQGLPPFVRTVIVVNRPEDAVDYPADLIQHYRDSLDRSRFGRGAQWRIRAFRIEGESSLEELRGYADPVGAVLLDAYSAGILGGSGHTFPWELAVRATALSDRPIILAGGLTPENVGDAIDRVRPYAVDVASGVELAPGVKDHSKVKSFIKAVRVLQI